MDKKREHPERSADNPTQAPDRRESGEPGGGQGRRDEIGTSGIYPPTADNIPPDAEVRMAGSWGGGDYYESGGSELVYRDGVVLGGTTAGPDGEPTLDIHEGDGRAPGARGDASGDTDDESDSPASVDPVELRMRGLPKGSPDEQAGRDDARGEPTQEQRRRP
jgi:hypothetical protein